MSLLDAFLNEPYPFEVWLAVRSDGAAGSGRADDPHNCARVSSAVYPDCTVSSLVQGGSTTVAVATCAAHGFSNNDMVTVWGVTSPGAISWCGTFPVSNVTTNTFSYTMNADPKEAAASGTTIRACKERERFDAVMRSAPDKTTLHLGPGVFETKGYAPGVAGSWQPKDGQSILGCGRQVTTLKLVGASVPDLHYVAIGMDYNNLNDGLVVADLTVDCNVAGQPIPPGQTFARISCGAVSVGTLHARVRRVRAINFGTQTAAQECFVIAVGFGHPNNAGNPKELKNSALADCILEQPGLNNVRETTGVVIFNGEDNLGRKSYPAACAIRDCHIDCSYQDRPVSIEKIVVSGGVATVTTRTPHGRNNNNDVVISGALVNGTQDNAFNGTYRVANASTLTFDLTPAPTWPAGAPYGEMWVGRYSSRLLSVALITVPAANTLRVKTTQPHNRKPGNNLVLAGVTVGPNARFNGSFVVSTVISRLEFDFVPGELLDPLHPPTFTNFGKLGVLFQALSGDGGTGTVLERNRVFHSIVGGSYHDTWGSRDLWMRDNYYHDVLRGPYQNMGASSFDPDGTVIKSLSVTAGVVTVETFELHGLRPFDPVTILGCDIMGANTPSATVQVFGVPTATSFTCQAPGAAGGTAGTPGRYGAWGRGVGYGLRSLAAIARVADGAGGFLVTATTLNDHGLEKGSAVQVTNAAPWSVGSGYGGRTSYEGYFVVEDTPSPTTFRYRVATDPGGNSNGTNFSAGWFGALWQSRRLVYEANLFELPGWFGDEGAPMGIFAASDLQQQPPPYTFPEVVIRENVTLHVDERYGALATLHTRGVTLASCGNGLVEENLLVSGEDIGPVVVAKSGPVRAWYNQFPDGKPIRGYNQDTPAKVDDISTRIEDIQTLALL